MSLLWQGHWSVVGLKGGSRAGCACGSPGGPGLMQLKPHLPPRPTACSPLGGRGGEGGRRQGRQLPLLCFCSRPVAPPPPGSFEEALGSCLHSPGVLLRRPCRLFEGVSQCMGSGIEPQGRGRLKIFEPPPPPGGSLREFLSAALPRPCPLLRLLLRRRFFWLGWLSFGCCGAPWGSGRKLSGSGAVLVWAGPPAGLCVALAGWLPA